MSPNRERKRTPWYFLSILFLFLVPVNALLILAWKKTDKPAFLKSFLTILALGYAWSMLVTSQGWWSFNPEIMLGIRVLPALPLEEAFFYPLGGALSILLYAALTRTAAPEKGTGRGFCFFIIALTLCGAAAVAVSMLNGGRPYYLISQIILYNGLAAGLWPWTHGRIGARPALLATAVMTGIGFFWNWLAFTQGWWSYHAVLGWMWPAAVPVDDWNFYIFAPLAAISLYENFRRGGDKA